HREPVADVAAASGARLRQPQPLGDASPWREQRRLPERARWLRGGKLRTVESAQTSCRAAHGAGDDEDVAGAAGVTAEAPATIERSSHSDVDHDGPGGVADVATDQSAPGVASGGHEPSLDLEDVVEQCRARCAER